jgi:hypothetical protein
MPSSFSRDQVTAEYGVKLTADEILKIAQAFGRPGTDDAIFQFFNDLDSAIRRGEAKPL